MRVYVAIVLLAPALLLFAQTPVNTEIGILIKKLASNSFQERQTAIELLKKRPEAIPALREALRSSDLELRQRAAEVLEYHDRKPVRELEALAQQGNFQQFTELLAAWPAGRFEKDVWLSYCDLSRRLVQIHENKGGAKIKLRLDGRENQLVLSAKRITEDTKGEPERPYFLRANEIDLVYRRSKVKPQGQNWFSDFAVFVASGPVRVITGTPDILFAGGSVELIGGTFQHVLVVSGGDVTLKGEVAFSLIIARGNVNVNCVGDLARSRIISGKSVTISGTPNDCLISENDLNPLGFIRWSDGPKEKSKPQPR